MLKFNPSSFSDLRIQSFFIPELLPAGKFGRLAVREIDLSCPIEAHILAIINKAADDRILGFKMGGQTYLNSKAISMLKKKESEAGPKVERAEVKGIEVEETD